MKHMDVALLGNETIRIKGKQGVVVVDPRTLTTKTDADGVLLLTEEKSPSFPKVESYRVVIQGGGEYEISSIKITGTKDNADILYEIRVDGLSMLVATTDMLEKLREKLGEYHVAVLKTTSVLNEEAIAALQPKIVAFYGEKAKETYDLLTKDFQQSEEGKANAKAMHAQKFSATNERLPSELQIIWLG